jgi:Ni,Fe-hydrogenase I small subunit
LASGKVTILTPKNSQAFPADAWIAREATYIPDADVVVICTPGKPAQHTLVYDCAADAWLCMAEAPAVDDRGRPLPLYGVNSGIEWDAKRKLLWHVAARGEVHVLRFDLATAGLRPLTPASQPDRDGKVLP